MEVPYKTKSRITIGEGSGTPLQYSCLENPMDGGAWCCSPWGRCELDTTERLHFHYSLSSLEKETATPSSVQCSTIYNR